MDVSVIIPAKDEEKSIAELSQWIGRVMAAHHLSYEVIFIDDGSEDGTWREMVRMSEVNVAIKAIKFNRNFGKSAALQTGFRAAQGDIVITLDADLQDSPEEIPALVKMVREENFHLVSGW
ncbi:MAG: glycosyltransferase, partial [Cyclobacteriaceae bacterium]|nr:glycosyltransferase [Cyclobacteriaceae bacterium]